MKRTPHPWTIATAAVAVSIAILATAGYASIAGAGGTNRNAPSPQSLSGEERDALDSATRSAMSYMTTHLAYHALLPAALPAGHTYAHLHWDGNPNDGFNLFVSSATESRAIHLLEGHGPIRPGSKDSKRTYASDLRPAVIGGINWYSMQKPDQPWKGEWIFLTDTQGLRLEVDGLAPPTLLVQFIESLR